MAMFKFKYDWDEEMDGEESFGVEYRTDAMCRDEIVRHFGNFMKACGYCMPDEAVIVNKYEHDCPECQAEIKKWGNEYDDS